MTFKVSFLISELRKGRRRFQGASKAGPARRSSWIRQTVSRKQHCEITYVSYGIKAERSVFRSTYKCVKRNILCRIMFCKHKRPPPPHIDTHIHRHTPSYIQHHKIAERSLKSGIFDFQREKRHPLASFLKESMLQKLLNFCQRKPKVRLQLPLRFRDLDRYNRCNVFIMFFCAYKFQYRL